MASNLIAMASNLLAMASPGFGMIQIALVQLGQFCRSDVPEAGILRSATEEYPDILPR